MILNAINEIFDFTDDIEDDYRLEIKGDNPTAFTRNRKVTPLPLLLQMFGQKGKTQQAELIDFYKDIDRPLDISTVGFFQNRMKFNESAVRLMSNDFITDMYDKHDDKMVKLNDYLVTAIDGSKFILPSTKENEEYFGRFVSGKATPENSPVMGMMSTLYDCINKMVLDIQVDKFKTSERKLAEAHLGVAKENFRQKMVTIFDRGYYSIKLVDQLQECGQKYLFRLPKTTLKNFSNQLEIGEDKVFNLTFDRATTNRYREDSKFRTKLMNTTYPIRIAKISIGTNSDGTIIEEILATNLSSEEFDIEGLKELYNLRWAVETAYNILKNRMKIEEFSGYRTRLILQDIYCTVWLYNLTMLKLIEVDQKHKIPQERYKYEMKRNLNAAIGVMKTYLVKTIMGASKSQKKEYLNQMDQLIIKQLIPIRKDRKFRRANAKNKSRMSYRYSY
jgi:Transposase DDE domain.